MRLLFIGSLVLVAPLLAAQQPIGRTSATEVQVSGAVDISHGETTLGNGSEITAGKQVANYDCAQPAAFTSRRTDPSTTRPTAR
jgi:hypothetical protein